MIGGFATSLLLTLLLVPVVYVALAVDSTRGGDSSSMRTRRTRTSGEP